MRLYKPTPYFALFIAILCVVIAGTYLCLCILWFTAAKQQDVTQRVTLTAGSHYPQPHRPDKCRHLYNVNKHREWADCMGVGYVPKAD